MGASGALRHVRSLDRAWAALLRGERPPTPLSTSARGSLPPTDGEFDIVYAGGGLALLHALAMQRRGRRVLLFDRRPVGTTHREWNITRAEIAPLAAAGILEPAALERATAREYERGLLQFFDPAGPPLQFDLPGVLDLALDAPTLLGEARAAFEDAGGKVLEESSFEHAALAATGSPRAVVTVRAPGGERRFGARLLVNGMGALSPLTLALAGSRLPFDGVCPTVGTVARGFAPGEVDAATGEILVTIGGAEAGRQQIWEGFPGRGDRFTTYLFYYDVTEGREAAPHRLESLFESYFHRLGHYKRPGASFRHLRPVYGFIPSRHRLDGPPAERARTARGLLSVGDAVARQNPLTFTGFGAFVRSLPSAAARLDARMAEGDLEAESLAAVVEAGRHPEGMWVMARFLSPRRDGDDVNGILRDFTRALEGVGAEQAADFFLDRASWASYVEIMLRTARRRPRVFGESFGVLGTRGVGRWLEELARWGMRERAAGR